MIDVLGNGGVGVSQTMSMGGEMNDPRFASLATGSTADLVRRYRAGVGSIDRRVFQLDDSALTRTFTETQTVIDTDGVELPVGRWSVRTLLGHLADAELIFTTRMRRVIAEENPLLADWDENTFLESSIYTGVADVGDRTVAQAHGVLANDAGWKPQAIGGHVAIIHTLRQWMGEWLGQMPISAWNRRGLHERKGPMSLADLTVYTTWHLEHHSAYLRAKVLTLLGPEQDMSSCESAAKAGGCGVGCGCVGKSEATSNENSTS